MVKLRACLALVIVAALTGSAGAASGVKKPAPSPAEKGSIVTDHIPEFDGPITTLTGLDGRAWAVWTFHAAHESDVAIASREANATTWSAPVFFGRRNGIDEIDPTIAMLRGALADLDQAKPADRYTRQRLQELLEFFETMTALYDDLHRLPIAALRSVARTRGKVRKLLAVK